MKSQLFTIVFFICFGLFNIASSQITVTLDDLEYSENDYYKMYGRTSLYIVQGLTGKIGGPHTWDFSSGPTDISYTFDYVLPSSTPYVGDFPNATIAEKRTGDGDEAFMFLDFLDGTGRVNFGVFQPGLMTDPYVFDPPITDFPETIEFMDFWDGATTFNASLSGLDIDANYTYTSFCNAYGTLTLPDGLGDFPCLQVNNLEHFEFYWSGILMQEVYIRSIYWLIEDAGIAVIVVSEEGTSPPPEDFAYSSAYSRMFESSKFTTSNEFSLNLKVLLEGPYSSASGTMNTHLNPDFIPVSQPYNILPWNYIGDESVENFPSTDIVDWVLIELRDTTDASLASENTRIAQQAAFLLNTGEVVSMDGVSIPIFDIPITNNLFALVWHRNHIGVLSAEPLFGIDAIYSYDFSTDAMKAFNGSTGHNEIASGIWGMTAGDSDADMNISAGDIVNFWNAETGLQGYHSADFDLNSQVNNQDKNDFWLPNLGSGSILP